VIDFRYHLVSIVAVFLALALGMFIGSTTLRPKVAQDLKNRVDNAKAANVRLSDENDALDKQLDEARAFETDVLPYAVDGSLGGQTVTVVSLPDTDNDQRDAVVAGLTAADAIVTGDVRLREPLLDFSQDAFLRTLTERLALPGRALPQSSGTDRALALLAEVLGHRPQGPAVSQASAARVLSAYDAGKLLSFSGDTPRPASLVVIVAGPSPEPSATPSASASASATASPDEDVEALLASFARYLDEAAIGAVVSGPTQADEDAGLLAYIRGEKTLRSNVSTVDGADGPRGVIATVFALAEQRDGGAGSYGAADGVDGTMPSRSPS
jgi:hypothetical protein